MLLRDKVSIITGGASGIGEATAKWFSDCGAVVVIADINEAEGRRVLEEIRLDHGRDDGSCFIRADVSSAAEVQALIKEVTARFGRLDLVINNAATILPKPLESVKEEEWDRLMAINLKSVYLMIQQAIPHLRKVRGSIVNMASLNGLVGQGQNASYSASKGGIIAMTKALALDYAPDGVRINCICPAGVATPLLNEWIGRQEDSQEAQRALAAMHPLGRLATSEEIAKAAAFLASDLASFVTGVALPVDGGASLGY